MKFDDLHKQPEGQNLGFKTSFGRETVETVTAFSNGLKPEDLLKGDYVAVHRNKLLAEAFYLRGDIEKFGTGYYRIQTEMKNYPEIQFSFELMDGFMRCTLGVTAQDTAQDTHQDKHLVYNAIGHNGLGEIQDTHQDTAQDTAQVRDLIMNFEGEMYREEIQKKLKLTHRENFRKFSRCRIN
ncbi:MAG: RecG ATP-dependent DNA helicase [Bacteroidetes bacterium]|nr:MAG: RecG ATP-dependent DNA helicase [Bacteroidota bacterium]